MFNRIYPFEIELAHFEDLEAIVDHRPKLPATALSSAFAAYCRPWTLFVPHVEDFSVLLVESSSPPRVDRRSFRFGLQRFWIGRTLALISVLLIIGFGFHTFASYDATWKFGCLESPTRFYSSQTLRFSCQFIHSGCRGSSSNRREDCWKSTNATGTCGSLSFPTSALDDVCADEFSDRQDTDPYGFWNGTVWVQTSVPWAQRTFGCNQLCPLVYKDNYKVFYFIFMVERLLGGVALRFFSHDSFFYPSIDAPLNFLLQFYQLVFPLYPVTDMSLLLNLQKQFQLHMYYDVITLSLILWIVLFYHRFETKTLKTNYLNFCLYIVLLLIKASTAGIFIIWFLGGNFPLSIGSILRIWLGIRVEGDAVSNELIEAQPSEIIGLRLVIVLLISVELFLSVFSALWISRQQNALRDSFIVEIPKQIVHAPVSAYKESNCVDRATQQPLTELSADDIKCYRFSCLRYSVNAIRRAAACWWDQHNFVDSSPESTRSCVCAPIEMLRP